MLFFLLASSHFDRAPISTGSTQYLEGKSFFFPLSVRSITADVCVYFLAAEADALKGDRYFTAHPSSFLLRPHSPSVFLTSQTRFLWISRHYKTEL